ncbi:hypothetical protein WZ342_2587 [Enterococcus faecalis]|nr:hypothetical protein WZ342_2587 [Enterococcus faecalis]
MAKYFDGGYIIPHFRLIFANHFPQLRFSVLSIYKVEKTLQLVLCISHLAFHLFRCVDGC